MANDNDNAAAGQDIAPRACGSCTLCCKLLEIPELQKPSGKWCQHVAQGLGCKIYESRPDPCRRFLCEWAADSGMDAIWQPDRAKFFIYRASPQMHLIVVDPGAPHAWKAPQFYPSIKLISSQFTENGAMVVVCIGKRRIVVLPDRDEDLGLDAHDKILTLDRVMGPEGPRFAVRIEPGGTQPQA